MEEDVTSIWVIILDDNADNMNPKGYFNTICTGREAYHLAFQTITVPKSGFN